MKKHWEIMDEILAQLAQSKSARVGYTTISVKSHALESSEEVLLYLYLLKDAGFVENFHTKPDIFRITYLGLSHWRFPKKFPYPASK
jgi:hypothetical protein